MSIAAGVLAAIILVGAGAALLLSSSKHWSAQTTVVVLPRTGIDVGNAASYYDTLSHGQITSTVAQILALSSTKQLAGGQLHLPAAQIDSVSISTTAVTGTALVTVSASAPTAQVASEMADSVVSQGTPEVNQLITPYAMIVVSQTNGQATQSGGSNTSKYLVVLVVVAVALGFGVQQGFTQLMAAVGRRPGRRRPAVRRWMPRRQRDWRETSVPIAAHDDVGRFSDHEDAEPEPAEIDPWGALAGPDARRGRGKPR
jgi:capsular polysaccharide biosynthesis protein